MRRIDVLLSVLADDEVTAGDVTSAVHEALRAAPGVREHSMAVVKDEGAPDPADPLGWRAAERDRQCSYCRATGTLEVSVAMGPSPLTPIGAGGIVSMVPAGAAYRCTRCAYSWRIVNGQFYPW